MAIATANNIKKGEETIEEIREIVCDWEHYAKRVKVSSQLTGSITNTLAAFRF